LRSGHHVSEFWPRVDRLDTRFQSREDASPGPKLSSAGQHLFTGGQGANLSGQPVPFEWLVNNQPLVRVFYIDLEKSGELKGLQPSVLVRQDLGRSCLYWNPFRFVCGL